jgi:PAS domain S-box-containing protein
MRQGWFTARLSSQSRLGDYVRAIAIVAVAWLARTVLELIAPGVPYFVVLLPAVVLAGVFCGTLPAAAAAAAAAVATALFPGGALKPWPLFNATQIDALLFLPACVTALWATHAVRRAASDAAETEARLREVFRQIPGTAAILEAPEGRLMMRSAQSDMVLGHRAREVACSSDLESYGGIHQDGTSLTADEYPIVRALKTGEVVSAEQILYRRPDGRVVDLEVHAGPVRGPQGRIIAAVGMAFDVSERVEAERRLRASETEYRAAAERLRAALEARDVLMHEADHRIKNSLWLVVALLRLQLARVPDRDAKNALVEAIARVNAVANAHEALQYSPNLRSIEIDRMLADLCARVGSLNPDVTIDCDTIVGQMIDAEQAIPLGLIVSEVLTNALRHAYPAGTPGSVTLTARKTGDGISVTIVDRGAGMPASPVPVGLGSTVMATLAQQIGATIATESRPAHGTTVTLHLQLPDAGRQD